MAPKLAAVQPVLGSSSVPRSIRFFAQLGFTLGGLDNPDDPRYAWIRRDGLELHLQWHAAAVWDGVSDKPTYRFVVTDVDGLHREFSARQIADMKPVRDTPWGTREFHVRDPDGNGLQFYRPL